MDTNFQPITSTNARGHYRQHSLEFRRALVVLSLEPGVSVARIAREHGVNANQVFSWRRLYQQGRLGLPALMRDDGLLPVVLAPTAPAPGNATADADGTIVLELGEVRVVYGEPYSKSKAKPLHRDSISVDPAVPSIDLVNFEPFEGVAPRQYQDIFDAGELLKDAEGKAVDWRGRGGKLRFLRFQNTYLDIETAVVSNEIRRLIRALNLGMPEV